MQLKWLVSIEWLHWYLIGSNITNPPQEICLNDVDSIMLFSLFANSEKVKKNCQVFILFDIVIILLLFILLFDLIWYSILLATHQWLHISCDFQGV